MPEQFMVCDITVIGSLHSKQMQPVGQSMLIFFLTPDIINISGS